MKRTANRRVLVALLVGMIITVFAAATALAQETPPQAQRACLYAAEEAKGALIGKADLCGPKT